MRFFLLSLHVLLHVFLRGACAWAQIPGVGIGWLINPEGSRLFPQPIIYPRHAGKPDPRWKVFDWHYRDFKTERTPWRLYFYDVGHRERSFWTAEYAAPVIDAQVRELASRFEYWPQEPFSYILFSSYREFQQANVFFIDEGVQGITSTQEPTMAIPYWGERETFRHISHHELVHQFQVQKLKSLSQGLPFEVRPIPLWLIEGMAEYFSLKGVDSESLAMLRDLYFNFSEKPDSKNELMDFFAPGPMDFQHVYKLGQLKIAFIEEGWGGSTLQRIFESCGSTLGSADAPTLESVFTRHLGIGVEQIQARWKKFLDARLLRGFEHNTGIEAFAQASSVGTTLDHFVVSPSGRAVLWREIDALTGGTSLRIGTFSKDGELTGSQEVTHDRQTSAVSLYFFQVPSLALARSSLAFIASTATGPEIELRTYSLKGPDEIEMGDGGRIRLHEYGLVQAHSPSFEPSEQRLAFVGIDSRGWQNVYVVDRDARNGGKPALRQLTRGAFSWKNLAWTKAGILAASDQDSPSGLYGIRLLDPVGLGSRLIIEPSLGFENLLEPVAVDPEREIVLRSANGRGQQIYRWTPMRGLQPLTRIRTMMLQPQLSSTGIHALAFQKGRFHLVRIHRPDEGRGPAAAVEPSDWDSTEVTPFSEGSVRRYQPFKGTGIRVEDFGAFFSSGAILGLSGTFSDLMRNDIVSADLLAISGLGVTQADVFWTSEEGRATWTLGAYHLRTSRIDRDHVESGALGAYQYPIGPYSSGTAVLRAGRIEQPGATSWMLAPSVSWGVDHVEYELFSGPIKGFGWLLEAGTEFFPSLGITTERLRLDASHYLKLWGRSLLATHLMAGHAFTLDDRGAGSPDLHNPFYVSSDDMFRAYTFNDDRLRGDSLIGAKSELRFPFGELFGFEPLRGLLAADIGSIWSASEKLGGNVSSSWSSGFCFNIPPLGFSFLFSRPIRVAPDPAGRPMDSSVFHFTLRYLYL